MPFANSISFFDADSALFVLTDRILTLESIIHQRTTYLRDIKPGAQNSADRHLPCRAS
jgi:hypothetical protein